MKPKFLTTAEKFREWLEKNHATSQELLIGFYKKDSGRKSITYSETLDEALCFGRIDGVRKRIDEISYTIRFTPRKPRIIWSNINVRHVERLKKDGRMKPPGLDAFALRDEKRTGIYSFENRPREFSADFSKRFRANKAAWSFFNKQAPFYKKTIIFWVMSAKKEETRLGRLNRLIDSSSRGVRVGLLAKTNK